MVMLLHKATQRGYAHHGWLESNFSFSFADYYDPAKMGFGALRVLNDDTIAPSKGFGMHPHKDMEIITIIQEGALEHQDNLGNKTVIKPGDVQVMSAGSGIVHAEMNASSTNQVSLFQLWIHPKEKGIPPRHDERTFPQKDNQLTLVASGNKADDALYIHQDAKVLVGSFTENTTYTANNHAGVFILVVDGQASIENELLQKRDAVAITQTASIQINIKEKTTLLVIEVPLL